MQFDSLDCFKELARRDSQLPHEFTYSVYAGSGWVFSVLWTFPTSH